MTIEIVVPELGESVVEATVMRWLKQAGEPVKAGEAVVELETEKVNLEVSAEQAGVLTEIKHQAGDDVQIGEVLGLVDPDQAGQSPPEKAAAKPASKESAKPEEKGKEPTDGAKAAPVETRATPMAKRLAAEYRLDLANIPPGDAASRVTKEDVTNYLQTTADVEEKQPEKAAAPKPSAPQPRPAGPMAGDRTAREARVRMSRRRQTIARRLVEAQQTAAMLTTFNEIDMSAVMAIRQRRQASFLKQHGIKLGFMSFFVKAAVGALKQFPQVNAEVEGQEIVLKYYYDIGMAIGAEEGLVVPVIRDADRLTFADIEQAIVDYVAKVKEGTLSLEDLRGGTFSITNGGVFGSLLSTPILNPPQVGILGLHKIEERPVVINGEIAIRPMMYVALTYDHRVVDGREAVQFLAQIKQLIEDPEVLLLEG